MIPEYDGSVTIEVNEKGSSVKVIFTPKNSSQPIAVSTIEVAACSEGMCFNLSHTGLRRYILHVSLP